MFDPTASWIFGKILRQIGDLAGLHNMGTGTVWLRFGLDPEDDGNEIIWSALIRADSGTPDRRDAHGPYWDLTPGEALNLSRQWTAIWNQRRFDRTVAAIQSAVTLTLSMPGGPTIGPGARVEGAVAEHAGAAAVKVIVATLNQHGDPAAAAAHWRAVCAALTIGG